MATATTPGLSDWLAVQGRRVLWHVNRSPLGQLVKLGVRVGNAGLVRERRAFARALPPAPALDASAASLRRDGYVRMNSVIDSAALEALGRAGAAKLARADDAARNQSMTASLKRHWDRLLDEDMTDGRLPTDNPFVAYALQEPVIGTIARYFGELPRLDYVLLTLSRNTGKPPESSQLWHRDHDDVRTVKLFAYLTDVRTLEDGPFTFLPGPASDRFGFSIRSHRPDSAIMQRVRTDEIKQMIAPRLSTFMVDTTRCLHMGSRMAPGHERLLYTATYTTVPRMFPEAAPRFRLTGRETPLERNVLARAV